MNRRRGMILIGFLVLITVGFLYLRVGMDEEKANPEQVFVDVKEGRVHVANGVGTLDLHPGDRGKIELGKSPTLVKIEIPTPVPDFPSVPRPRTLAVQVIDDASQVIEGASIFLKNKAGNLKDVQAGSIEVASATSDANGKADLTATVSGDEQVFAQKTDWFDSEPVMVGERSALTLVMDRKLSIFGKVLDQHNQPVSDARVSVFSATDTRLASAIATSATGATFSLFPFRPGMYRLQARHETLLGEERNVQAGEEAILHLGTSATVIVSVSTERGEAVGGADLDLTSKPNSGLRFTAEEKTDTFGRASFAEIRKGTYSIGIRHPWYQSLQRTDVVVDSVTEELSIVLPDKSHTISGRVLDAETQEPIAKAHVVCGLDWGVKDDFIARLKKQKNSPLSATRAVFTNEDGFYQFDGLWSGLYIVFVDRVEGYISGDVSELENMGGQRLQRAMLSDVENVESVDFYLKRGWRISGHVYDPEGKPLSQVQVSALLRYVNMAEGRARSVLLDQYGAECTTDDSGYYEILGSVELMPESSIAKLNVEGKHEKYGEVYGDSFYLKPGEAKDGVDLHFNNSVIVQGTVSNEDGQPIPDAIITMWLDESVKTKYFGILNFDEKTDRNGFYRIYLSEYFGDYFLRAHADGYQKSTKYESTRKITVSMGMDPVLCDFVLKKGQNGTIEGIVVNEEGEGLSGIFLTLQCNGSKIHQNPHQETNADGRFVFDLGAWDEEWFVQRNPSAQYPDRLSFFIAPKDTEEYEYIRPPWESTPFYVEGEKNARIVMSRKDKDRVSFRGMVTDAEGQPVVNYSIIVIPGSAPANFASGNIYYRWASVHSPDGSFFLENIPAKQGLFRIAVRSEEYGFVCTESLNPQPNQVMEGIVIRFGEGAEFRGVVLDKETGEPLEGVSVVTMLPPTVAQQQQLNSRLGRAGIYLVPSEQSQLLSNFSSATTDANGEFRLEKVVAISAVHVRFQLNKYEDYFLPVTRIQPGEMRDVGEIRMGKRLLSNP